METLKIVVITVLCSLCGVMLQEVVQPEGFKTAKLGQTVDIKSLTDSISGRVWYKLGSDRRLQLIASISPLFTPNAPIDNRYSVKSSKDENILTIKDMTVKDVGTYFCGISNINEIVFGSGTVLEIEGESEPVQSVLQSPEYIREKTGDSVTLSCSFTSRHCPRENISGVWVRSGCAVSEIVSSDHGKKIICESSSCVYNLTLKNISSAEDGTYLCVVTACGEIMIGKGTRIQLHEAVQSEVSSTVIVLTVLNVVFGVAVVVLVMVVCGARRKRVSDSCRGSADAPQAEGEVTYAGVNVVPRSAPRRPTSAAPRQESVVYSEVRNQRV